MVTVDLHAKKVASQEAARRERFLDAKTRTIGIDKAALDAQVAEKRAKARAEREEDRKWAEFNSAIVDLAGQHEVAAMDDAAALDKELRTTWRVQRDPTLRKEWDLNDPRALSKDLPPVTDDDESRVGVSALQVFDGEDKGKADREARLAAEQRAIVEEQLALKAARAAEDKEEDRKFAEFHAQLAEMLAEAEAVSTQEDLIKRLRLQQENLSAARAKRQAERAAAAAGLQRDIELMQAAMADPMLCEDRTLAFSAEGPHRVRRDHYKGMSVEDVEAIRETQRIQMEEARARRAKEEEEDRAYWAGIAAAVDFSLTVDASAAEGKAADQRKYYMELKAQQRADRMRKRAEDAERRGAGIDKEWFKGWNKTSTI